VGFSLKNFFLFRMLIVAIGLSDSASYWTNNYLRFNLTDLRTAVESTQRQGCRGHFPSLGANEMKTISKSDLENMIIRLNTVTGKGAWIYKDAQGIAIKDSKGSNMFSHCGLTRRDALNRCHAYIEGWQFARDAVLENWIAERTVISAPRSTTDMPYFTGGESNPLCPPSRLDGTTIIPCSNTLFVNGGAA
jgi:hypothetical protein